jgi:methionyl-tRNA formyltransferase
MNIVFFGSPTSAIPSFRRLVETGHNLRLVITQPDRPAGRGKKIVFSPVKKLALDLNIPICQPARIRKDAVVLQKMMALQPELNVVVAYGQIIPRDIIELPVFKTINLHFSLLPKYRGASPVQWALLNGENKTGITIMELNEKMDEGDILFQKEMEILPDDNTDRLEQRLSKEGAEILINTIADIERITPVPQDHSSATYAPKIKKEDGKIDWTRDAVDLENMIRAFSSWPSVYCFLKKTRIKVLKGKKIDCPDKTASPGEVICVDKRGIQIACGKKSVFLMEIVQPENRKAMDAHAFSLGRRLAAGDRFD